MTELEKRTNINIQHKANLIWAVASVIDGVFKPHEYGKVILPFTILKRLDDTLRPTKNKVLKKYEEVKKFEVKDGFLEKASGYKFYNTSPYTFENLLNDPDNIEENFKVYLAGFSDNVTDVLENFEFEAILKRLTGKTRSEDRLFFVIQEFNKKSAYMGVDKVSNVDMGYIFEELVRKFSESYNEEAGEHFTARDIIYTMTDILLAGDNESFSSEGTAKTIYDMAMGTSQMLTCMEERIKQLDNRASVSVFGQEINPETYAIAKSDMIIKGGDPDNMRQGDTLSNDKFDGYTFDYIISNPPFGRKWESSKKAVEAEHKKGEVGRFAPKLPKISDGQMLFTLNGIKKLKDKGRMAIIHNGSPLFTGDAGSGPSEIRKYIIENDYLEAIIQLPNDLFYNTGIATYIWVISNNGKSKQREGKVQLIDASNMYTKRRKAIGNKRVNIDAKTDRPLIVKAFGEFTNKVYGDKNKYVESKIFNNEDFGYYKITVESPKYDDEGKKLLKSGKPTADSKNRDYENVPMVIGEEPKVTIKNYFEKEVIPYNAEAWVDYKKTKVGYEIPFTRHFYKYEAPEKSAEIAKRINLIEKDLMNSLKELFDNE